MSRYHSQKVMADRKTAILRELPASEKDAIDGAKVRTVLGLTPTQFRYCIDVLWANGKVKYSGETRARVYWRTCPKPPAPKKPKS